MIVYESTNCPHCGLNKGLPSSVQNFETEPARKNFTNFGGSNKTTNLGCFSLIWGSFYVKLVFWESARLLKPSWPGSREFSAQIGPNLRFQTLLPTWESQVYFDNPVLLQYGNLCQTASRYQLKKLMQFWPMQFGRDYCSHGIRFAILTTQKTDERF